VKGIFLTFEGVEGSGKSTQAKLFVEWLKENGKEVLFLREPGSTNIGEEIRKILLSKENKGLSPETELFLFLASRAQLVREKIIPALKEGKVVVLDRYIDSTLAYQGYGDELPIELIEEMNKFATAGLLPDLTFLLDLDIDEGLKKAGMKDRIEEKGIQFHRKVREGYHKLAEKFPERIKLIQVEEDPQKTQQKIRQIFLQRFSFR
jgi:dTMP kinase